MGRTAATEKQRLASMTEAPQTQTGQFEQITEDLREKEMHGDCLSILQLRKQFNTPSGLKIAVNDVSLAMFPGQVFCLLGHNGAGNTTTLSILCGLLPPSGGDALIFGRSIKTHMSSIRQIMGVCPQHDVLFATLTVREHLLLYAGIKGVPNDQAANEAEEKIRQVGLVEKANVRSAQLSGGMKRKLSLAIALIGSSKIVFLDEPTSGMDPYSRRSTWNTIQDAKADRV